MLEAKIKGQGIIELARKSMQEIGGTGPRVRLSKLKPVEDPDVPTPDLKDYIPGGGSLNDGGSLPTGYVLEGFLYTDPEPGSIITMYRYMRSGEYVMGVATTSYVKSVEDGKGDTKVIRTANSVYIMEYIEDTKENFAIN